VRVVERRSVTADDPASKATAHDDPTLLGVMFHPDGFQYSPAVAGAIPGMDVDVKGVQAVGAVITAAAVRQWRHLRTAVETGEASIGTPSGETLHAASLPQSTIRATSPVFPSGVGQGVR